jgi:streptogramin lyase
MIAGTNLVVGSDGNIWFLESTGDIHGLVFRIGRITPAGQISEFLIPAFKGNRAEARQLTLGKDGNIWFTSITLAGRGTESNGFIGRVTTAGVITEFGTPTAVSNPGAIAVGSDGNVWFTEHNAIGRITSIGQVTEFPMPASCVGACGPAGLMVRGSDGNLWFSTQFPSGLGRITPTGQVSLFPEPNANQALAMIAGTNLTVGSDGNVWFLESTGDVHDQVFRIGRITTAGQITEFLIPAFKGNRAAANQLTAAPDGNIWFTSATLNGRIQSNGFIGRITTAGVITQFGTPTAVSDPDAIAIGSDNNVWFTEITAQAVGRATTH